MACRRPNGKNVIKRKRRRNKSRPSSNHRKPTARAFIAHCAMAPARLGSAPFRKIRRSHMAKSGFAKEHLKSFVDRIERLEEERSALTADIREVYSEAKGQGFDTMIMRQVVRMRKLDKADFQEQEAILDLYLNALGMR